MRELREYDRIVLTGFMGSGKSTLGERLAVALGWSFADLDMEIERREGRTVPQIFAERGERTFREAESDALAAVLPRMQMVLALGGGAPELAANRDLLAQSPRTAVVYLAADFQTLIARCQLQAADPAATARPLLADEAAAAARYASRQPLYEGVATHTFETRLLSAESGVDGILQLLGS
jgi:shikimate kinase